MKVIEIDREGECDFRVAWYVAGQRKTRFFDSRDAAESFAVDKMGRRGTIISTLDMTAEQLAANEARKARAKAFLASLKT